MKVIETHYQGYRFRSRLEARWAVFFDQMGIRWQYEPQGFELPSGRRYLPDFFLHIDDAWRLESGAGSWFEVKGIEPTSDELSLIQELAIGTGEVAYLAVGLPGENSFYSAGAIPQNRRISRCFEDHPWLVPQPLQLEMICNRWVCAPDKYSILNAMNCARRARFEYGQHGLS